MEKVWIYIENGTFLEAQSFGAKGTVVGEIVFKETVQKSGYIASNGLLCQAFTLSNAIGGIHYEA